MWKYGRHAFVLLILVTVSLEALSGIFKGTELYGIATLIVLAIVAIGYCFIYFRKKEEPPSGDGAGNLPTIKSFLQPRQ